MTKQEIFNKVYLGLKGQGFQRSVNNDGKCMYLGDEGRKCAAGFLIPDGEVITENVGWGASCSFLRGIQQSNYDTHLPDGYSKNYLIGDLQTIHDHSLLPGVMKAKLLELAASNGLTVPE